MTTGPSKADRDSIGGLYRVNPSTRRDASNPGRGPVRINAPSPGSPWPRNESSSSVPNPFSSNRMHNDLNKRGMKGGGVVNGMRPKQSPDDTRKNSLNAAKRRRLDLNSEDVSPEYLSPQTQTSSYFNAPRRENSVRSRKKEKSNPLPPSHRKEPMKDTIDLTDLPEDIEDIGEPVENPSMEHATFDDSKEDPSSDDPMNLFNTSKDKSEKGHQGRRKGKEKATLGMRNIQDGAETMALEKDFKSKRRSRSNSSSSIETFTDDERGSKAPPSKSLKAVSKSRGKDTDSIPNGTVKERLGIFEYNPKITPSIDLDPDEPTEIVKKPVVIPNTARVPTVQKPQTEKLLALRRSNGVHTVQQNGKDKTRQMDLRQFTGQAGAPQKWKNPFNVQPNDPLSDSTFNKPAGSSKAQSKGAVSGLPVLEAYFGESHFTSESNLRLFVEQSENKLCVKSAKGSSKFQSVEMLPTGIIEVEMTHAENVESNPEGYVLMKLTTEPIMGRRTVVKAQPAIPGYRGGNDYLADVLIKLDQRHGDWSKKAYDSIRSWLSKGGRKIQWIKFSSMKAIWQIHTNCLPQVIQSYESEPSESEYKVPIIPERREDPRKRKRTPTATPDPPDEHFIGMAAYDDEGLQPVNKVFEADTSRRRVSAPVTRSRDVTEPPAIRRSTRRSEGSNRQRSPIADPDEVILSYPPNTTGAVNVTNGDMFRLEDGEFLNDTIIEFGLKLWLKNLEDTMPEIAKQVHVFSSFFYKKLNVKDPKEGYNSVKKWTAKFNLFEKDYIMVPINENFHWWLAIIYKPGRTLNEPHPTLQDTPRRSSRNKGESEEDHTIEDARATLPSAAPEEPTQQEIESPGSSLEVSEVQKNLTSLTRSVSSLQVQEPRGDEEMEVDAAPHRPAGQYRHSPTADDKNDSDEDMYVQDESVDERAQVPRRSPSASNSLFDGPSSTKSDAGSSSRMHREREMEVDDGDNQSNTDLFEDDHDEDHKETIVVDDSERDDVEMSSPSRPRTSKDPVVDVEDISERSGAVSTGSFYAPAPKKRRDKPKVDDTLDLDDDEETPKASPDHVEIVSKGKDEPVIGKDTQPWILTLDSLGSRHVRACNVLREYLIMEANDKLNLPEEKLTKSNHKLALVPTQPDFFNCGVYLIHFVKTFMENPEVYFEQAVAKSKLDRDKRRELWKDEEVQHVRGTLKEKIMSMSEDWKKDKAVRDEERKKSEAIEVEDSDDDIEVIEDSKPEPLEKEREKKGKKTYQSANRIR